MNKTKMIQKNILSLVCVMTFCFISTTTAATAELVCTLHFAQAPRGMT
jgi:hypothetical protein